MSSYTVQQGDTLSAIAASHSISLDALLAANPGVVPENLQIGQVINLPGAPINQPGGDYVQYSGPASNFPPQDQWASYSSLWQANTRFIKFHDSDDEIALIKNAIETESGGNVRVGATNNGVSNPGLMQSHNGASFDPNNPAGSILQMVRDGTEGTRDGDCLKQLLARYGNYYEAFRGYNSGSVNAGDLNDPKGATGSYVRDAANRLMGHQWNGM